MRLDLTSVPLHRDGAPAILSAAWIQPALVAAATPAQRAAQVALLTTFRPDCLLWTPDAAGGVNFAQAADFARDTHLTVVLPEAPIDPTPPGLICLDPSTAPLPFPAELCAAEAQGFAGCSPGTWILAFARALASGATRWATRLFAAPPPVHDPGPAEQFARIAHRLQSFSRKQGDWLLRTQPLTLGANGYGVVEQPARLELTVRQLEDRPVVVVFAVNGSAHPVDGRLVLQLPALGREVDCGRLVIPAERFAVLHLARTPDKRTRHGQPPPEHPRKKGRSKADHTRETDLLNTGIRLSTLFHPTQV